MKQNKIRFSIFLTSIMLILCSCSQKPEQMDVSDKIITDLNCYKIEDTFNVEKYEMSEDVIERLQGYWFTEYFYEDSFYLLTNWRNCGVLGIAEYNFVTGEIKEIKKEKVAKYTNDSYSIAYAEKNVVFYFKRGASEQGRKLELYRIDVAENKEECIFSFNDAYRPTHNGLLYFNGALYFNDFYDSETVPGEYTTILYKHNIANNKTDIYAEDAESPKIYNDRIVFVRDDMYTDGENIILDPNKDGEIRVASIFFCGGNKGYTVSIYEGDTAVGMAFGIYDKDGYRKEIAKTDPLTAAGFTYEGEFDGLMTFRNGFYPVVYDSEKNVLYSMEVVPSREEVYVMQTRDNTIYLAKAENSTHTAGEFEEMTFYRITAK